MIPAERKRDKLITIITEDSKPTYWNYMAHHWDWIHQSLLVTDLLVWKLWVFRGKGKSDIVQKKKKN